jgi:shikimate dehydrogenase
MNVTAPFKEDIIEYLDSLDRTAATIGAVNTVVREEGGLKGYNTDYMGVMEVFRRRGIDLKDRRALVIGAGGAGRAAAYSLGKSGAEVTVISRSPDKTERFAGENSFNLSDFAALEELTKESEIIVYTLPPEARLINREWLDEKAVILDANYHASSLCEEIKVSRAVYIPGIEWLIEQAISSCEILIGQKPDETVMRSSLETSTRAADSFRTLCLTGQNEKLRNQVGENLASLSNRSFLLLQDQSDIARLMNKKASETLMISLATDMSKRSNLIQIKEFSFIISILGIDHDCEFARDYIEHSDLIISGYKSPEETAGRIYEEICKIFQA